ncbi:hypothetical protein CPB83DRAFT_873536 [Crepidotus variabilis]|uniref:Uncharacterized protein n=1 Tax=Crepidotus variabilis TaxID=179855 RepID=A0A9P6ERD0_9AGAR|nr:hypothetical protein CPB83DRAFT_873536 [Crepidotus variabilis]
MVLLSLTSLKGNAGLRTFPTTGYLGLTPVRVEGVVRTKLEADGKLLPATSLTVHVRCYEQRTRVASTQTKVLVDITQIVWTKPDNVEYESIGVVEYPFRLRIPTNVPGFSSAAFVDYRCTWRLEAVLSHVSLNGIISRQVRHFDLNLVRYDVPPWIPTSLKPDPFLGQIINKPRAPRIRYSVYPPRTAVGPLDLVSIPIHLQAVDRDISIRGASVTVERRIFLNENPSPASSSSVPRGSTQPSPTYPHLPPNPSSSSLSKDLYEPTLVYSSRANSTSAETLPPDYDDIAAESASLNSSNPTITPGTVYTSVASPPSGSNSSPLPPHSSQFTNAKVVAHTIASVESSGSFSQDSNGILSKTLTLQWPASKSRYRWAIGETISSDLVSVRFFVRTKISVSSPWGSETIELADVELFVVSTNETERQLAISRYAELQETASLSSTRSKSKSPRRKRSDRADDDAIPPSPAVHAALSNIGNSPTASGSGVKAPTSRKVNPRRPHTSAGPRDKPVNFAGGAYGQTRGREEEATASASTQISSSTGHGSHGTSAGNVVPPTTKRRSEFIIRGSTASHPEPKEGHAFGSASSTSSSSSSTKKGFLGSSGRVTSPNSTNSHSSSFIGGPSEPTGSGHSSKLSSSSFWSTVHSNPVLTSPKLKEAPSGSSTSTTNSFSSMRSTSSYSSVDRSSEGVPSSSGDHIREWEEELESIEKRSRKSSDLLSLFRRRKKSSPDLTASRS